MDQLSQEALEARRAYQKEWRRKNPEKVREKNRRYWERRAQRKEDAEHEQTAAD